MGWRDPIETYVAVGILEVDHASGGKTPLHPLATADYPSRLGFRRACRVQVRHSSGMMP